MPKKQRRAKRLPMKQIILRTLIAGGVLSMAVVAPNAVRLLQVFDRGRTHRANLYRRISQAISRLEREGFVQTSGRYEQRVVKLTKRGKAVVDAMYASEYQIPEPILWDGKWRIVMFDIREKRRKTRTQLRAMLMGVGFLRLQDSVWVYPYQCDEFISLVRTHLRSGTGEMLSFVAEALESDKKLRDHFNLS